MAFSTPYTFGFAAAICVTCSLVVASVAQVLREQQEINEARDVQGSILTALGVEVGGDDGLTGEGIDTLVPRNQEQDGDTYFGIVLR